MNNSIRDAFFTALDGRIHSEESTSVSLATEQAYQHDWNRFSQWCLDQESIELPAHPKTVSLFLRSEQEAGAGAATLNRRVAAISYMHRNANLPPPLAHGEAALIREVLARPKTSVRRRSAQRPGIENWRLVLEAIPEIDPEDLRDRALVALHVSAAFRLLELARLAVAQVRLDRTSAQIHLGRFRSHTARGSSAITVNDDLSLTPVSHLRRWMEANSEEEGSLFRHCTSGRVTEDPLREADIAAIMAARAMAAGFVLKRAAGGLFQVREREPRDG